MDDGAFLRIVEADIVMNSALNFSSCCLGVSKGELGSATRDQVCAEGGVGAGV